MNRFIFKSQGHVHVTDRKPHFSFSAGAQRATGGRYQNVISFPFNKLTNHGISEMKLVTYVVVLYVT